MSAASLGKNTALSSGLQPPYGVPWGLLGTGPASCCRAGVQGALIAACLLVAWPGHQGHPAEHMWGRGPCWLAHPTALQSRPTQPAPPLSAGVQRVPEAGPPSPLTSSSISGPRATPCRVDSLGVLLRQEQQAHFRGKEIWSPESEDVDSGHFLTHWPTFLHPSPAQDRGIAW